MIRANPQLPQFGSPRNENYRVFNNNSQRPPIEVPQLPNESIRPIIRPRVNRNVNFIIFNKILGELRKFLLTILLILVSYLKSCPKVSKTSVIYDKQRNKRD